MANTLKFGNGKWYGKEGTILAYNDENYNYKPLPFNFERGSSATVVNKDGLIETVGSDMPRIDYKDDSEGALLLEPIRSNLFTYSEDFSASIWDLNGSATREVNATISPNGTLNAYKITSNGGSISYGRGGVISENSTYEISFFAKKGTDNIIQITESFYFGSSTIFDLESGSITSGNGTIESYSNDWYRCSVSYTYGAGQSILSFNLKNTGSGYFYLFGFQGEQGSYATSYIPTQGSAVTRLADVCNNGGNDQVINSTEGTMYVEANLIDGYDNNNWLGIIYQNSNENNRIYIQRYLGNIQGGIRVNGAIQSEITQSNSSAGKNKIAFAYKLNEFKMFVNGSQVGVTDTIGSVFSADTLDKLSVGVYHNDTLNFNNVINDFRLYNTALTDAELKALTT